MNLVVIVLDTLRKDRVSTYNESIEFTPNLEEFGRDSTVYEKAYSQSTWSLPSQTSFLTGKYVWEHKTSQQKPFLSNEEILPEKLDLDSKIIHNNTWLIPITGVINGFDEVDCPHQYLSKFEWLWKQSEKSDFLKKLQKKLILKQSSRNLDSLMDKETSVEREVENTTDYLEQQSDDFFLYLNLVSCHYPYSPPEDYKQKHNIEKSTCNFESKPLEYGGPVKKSEMDDIKKLYDAEVDYLDDKFGEIIAKLKEEEMYENSLIVVYSDHGEMLGEDNKFGHHFSTNENLIEVPLMVKYPNEVNGVNDSVTEVREIHHKILEQFGKDGERKISNTARGIYEKPTIYGFNKYNKPSYYKVSPEGIDRKEKDLGEIDE